MLLDSTFLIHLEKEVRARQREADTPPGPALRFLARHAGRGLGISPVCAGEFYAGCEDLADARRFLSPYVRLALTDAVAGQAGLLEREQTARGRKLGENDNWIAATARLHRRPVVSRDTAFDRLRGVRRVSY